MTEDDNSINISENERITKSPSLSSLSSNSSSSTKNLIQSLSMHQINNPLEENKENAVPPSVISNGENANTSVDSTNMSNSTILNSTEKFPQNLTVQKRPIKFKVRKVSHGPVENSSTGRKVSTGKSQSENPKSKPNLKASQEKYDQYVNRIGKINKEIDFLVNLLPPYNVEIDYATRTKITRAIEKLKMKQDELEKKKYSLGMTISRLWRDYDDSDVWIRSFSNQ